MGVQKHLFQSTPTYFSYFKEKMLQEKKRIKLIKAYTFNPNLSTESEISLNYIKILTLYFIITYFIKFLFNFCALLIEIIAICF